jgi:endonuclease-8
MPEGNRIRIYKDMLLKYKGKTITDIEGSTKKIKVRELKNRKISDIFKVGKLLFIELDNGDILRFHFLLYGSLQLNPVNKTKPILLLTIGGDKIRFNTSSIKLLSPKEFNELNLDITLDPTDTRYSKVKSIKTFKEYIQSHPNEIIADTLMNQDIFPGIGNIIKNESLYLARINPNRKLSTLSNGDIKILIDSIRKFSLLFYKMEKPEVEKGKKKYVSNEASGQDFLNVYIGDTCPNGEKIVRKEIGKLKRMTMWCSSIQV